MRIFYKPIYYTLIITVCLFLSVGLLNAQSDRGVTLTEEIEEKPETMKILNGNVSPRLNTKQAFNRLQRNNSVAFLVGNNDYRESSDFVPLTQCENDVLLMSAILKTCCNMSESNIIAHTNLTAGEFKILFQTTIRNLKRNQGFIFMYSGHGDKDGSLVFTDGSRITPGELKALINAFENDTIMLIDACYSGNNDGPKNINPDHQFKKNCVRIYSSLAHLSAKEISYNHDYFDDLQFFYRYILGLQGDDAITGNGYFTSFIGYFFAEYELERFNKASINDLFTYISNKSKNYVEHLALRSGDDESDLYSTELTLRMDQHPKILPYHHEVEFRYPSNKLLSKRFRRFDILSLEASVGPMIYLGTLEPDSYRSPSVNIATVTGLVRLSISPSVLQGFFFGLETGYASFYRDPSLEPPMYMVPVVGLFGYRHRFKKTKNLLGFRSDIGIGISYGYIYSQNPDNDPNTISLKMQTGVGLALHPLEGLCIGLDVQYHAMLGRQNENDTMLNTLSHGLVVPVSLRYTF